MLQITLKAARVNAGLKQREAAKLMNIDVATIISWEKNKTAPRIPQLRQLCDIYSVSIGDIFLVEKSALSEQEGA